MGNCYVTGGDIRADDINNEVPVGIIYPWAAMSSITTIPRYYLECNGQAVSRTTYADLFAVIGTQFGAGNGSTTFNVPNLKGRVIAGLDAVQAEFNAIGKTGGEKSHALTIDEIPSHKHSIRGGNEIAGEQWAGVDWTYGQRGYYVSSEAIGGGQSHNNLQPYITMRFLIRAK